MPSRHVSIALGAIALSAAGGCAFEGLLHNTASLGGSVAGQRGNAQVLFINNTPFRAIFTFGAYDDLDRDTVPTLRQFSSSTTTANLEGDSQTSLIAIQCSRVFSIGGEGLLARVQENLAEDQFNDDALVSGINFSSAPVDDEMADEPTEGTALPVDLLIGVDFECGSMVIFRLEVNDLGPEEFQVDVSVIPAESTRG